MSTEREVKDISYKDYRDSRFNVDDASLLADNFNSRPNPCNLVTVDGRSYYTVEEIATDNKWHGPFWLKRVVDHPIIMTDMWPGSENTDE